MINFVKFYEIFKKNIEVQQRHLKNIIGFGLLLVTLIVYYRTLAPSVNFIDSGELSAVCSTLGIAHPTGYPLFTLIGYLFTKLPLDWLIIKKVNLMSATFSALGLFVFYHLLTLLSLKILDSTKYIKELYVYLVSAASALILGFSKTYWSQSTSIEVYSLHILFISLILYFCIKFIIDIDNNSIFRFDLKNFLLLFFILGLSFSNHMTTILFLPGIVYLMYKVFKFRESNIKYLFYGFILLLMGITTYLYLPIRASQEPFFNWGNPNNLERFVWHISGKQYRVWIFTSFESAFKQLEYYITNFYNEFNILLIAIGLFGAYMLMKNKRKIFIFFLILFLTCIGYSINYDIHDIDSYFLLSYFVFAIWISTGFFYLVQLRLKKILIVYIILILPIISLMYNYSKCDESKNFLVEDYMKNVFNSVEAGSIIISYQWDYFISASYYFQEVENYRKDVIVIDKELLRRSWYFTQIKNNYPEIYNKSKHEIELFSDELYKFEHNIPYNVQLIERRYSDVIRSFIEHNYDERKIYVTPEIENQYIEGYKKIPSGLCYQLVKDDKDIANRQVEFSYRAIDKEDRLINMMKNLYVRACVENGVYNLSRGEIIGALRYIETGLKIDPNSSELRRYYGQIKARLGK